MRFWLFTVLLSMSACGGNVFRCDEGEHRSGDGCAPDRVHGQSDTGGGEDTGDG